MYRGLGGKVDNISTVVNKNCVSYNQYFFE